MDTHFNSHLSIFQWYRGPEVNWSRKQEVTSIIGGETQRPGFHDVMFLCVEESRSHKIYWRRKPDVINVIGKDTGGYEVYWWRKSQRPWGFVVEEMRGHEVYWRRKPDAINFIGKDIGGHEGYWRKNSQKPWGFVVKEI